MATQRTTISDQDPFDTLLTLEDTLYNSAYALGTRDGARAGRIEGRIFGLEKGFEKFAAMGVLHGRACIWGARVPGLGEEERPRRGGARESGKEEEGSVEPRTTATDDSEEIGAQPRPVPQLPMNARLRKHITTLHALTDPLTFSTANDEDAVADFDDRFKRASAKTKVIERTIGENGASDAAVSTSPSSQERSTAREIKSPKKGRSVKVSGEGRKEDSMEDFGGSRFLA